MFKISKIAIIFLFLFNYSLNSTKKLINKIIKINFLLKYNFNKKLSEKIDNNFNEKNEIYIEYFENKIKDKIFDNYYLIFYGKNKKLISKNCFFKILNNKKSRNLFACNLLNKFKIYDEIERLSFLIDFNLYLDKLNKKK